MITPQFIMLGKPVKTEELLCSTTGDTSDSSGRVKRCVSEPSVLDEESITKDCEDRSSLKMPEPNSSVSGDVEVDLDGYCQNGTTQKGMQSTPVVEMCVHEEVHGEEIEEEEDDSHLWLPSAEEERFLISLGWSANEEVTLLTEEEISAWQEQKKMHSSMPLRSPGAQRSAQRFSSYSCSAFHMNTLRQQRLLVGSEMTTSDSDSM